MTLHVESTCNVIVIVIVYIVDNDYYYDIACVNTCSTVCIKINIVSAFIIIIDLFCRL